MLELSNSKLQAIPFFFFRKDANVHKGPTCYVILTRIRIHFSNENKSISVLENVIVYLPNKSLQNDILLKVLNRRLNRQS